MLTASNRQQATHRATIAGVTAVEVLAGDSWRPGRLDRWKHDHRGWVGYVWWSEGVGLQHVEWITADRLRPESSGAGGGDRRH